MLTAEQYRAKEVEYGELAKTSAGPDERREFQKLKDSYAVLAENEQWVEDNHNKTVHASEGVSGGETPALEGETLTAEEEHVLQCLGGALIMQWNTLPTKLRRELFDNAGSMGELLKTEELRGQIARFLHKHNK
ncbi:MAG: hypothetical protein K0Q64_1825 [Nitrobacter vulgaris]|jgi:hypothetical protein|nr:hypothetical protein [Nitrobacter vulgaris]